MRVRLVAISCVALLQMCLPVGAHEGVPIDPGITESTPREFSKLYLERKTDPWKQIEDGVEFQEVRGGEGATPYTNAITFIMWRMFDATDGKEVFYRTKHRTDNFFYGSDQGEAVGGGSVLRAVQLALKEMREGGKRLVRIKADKAFGKDGWSDSHFVVPPNTDMVIELSLLFVRDPDPKRFSEGKPHARPYDLLAARKESATTQTSATKAIN